MSDNNLPQMKADIKISADVTKALDTAVSTAAAPVTGICKGIAKICNALVDPWVEERQRKAYLIAAQTEKDIEDIRNGKKELRHGKLFSIAEMPSLAGYYQQFSELNAVRDARRLEAAMLNAAEEIKQIPDDQISDEPLNQTFFNHWRKEAELIDDEELRKWWAHLLVEETKESNSISPRTLDVAKNLSRNEAKRFYALAQGMVANCIVVDKDDCPANGNYADILMLQDAGLIGQTSSHYAKVESIGQIIIFNLTPLNYCLLIEGMDRVSFRCHILTTAGRELLKCIDPPVNLDYIKTVAMEISKQNRNIEIKLYPLKSSISLYDKTLWSTKQMNNGKGQKQ